VGLGHTTRIAVGAVGALVAVLAIAVSASGCGSDSGSSTGSTGSTDATASTASVADASDLPPGTVATVDGTEITQEQFDRALDQAAAAQGLKEVPAHGAKYDKLADAALGALLDTAWIKGEAEDNDLHATEAEIADKLAETKKEQFKSEGEFQDFLRKQHYTADDVNERIETQLLSDKLQAKVGQECGSKTERDAHFAGFIYDYKNRWRERTLCAPDLVNDRCRNGPPITGKKPAPAPC
jgi:parvulin-like peptidyl-prolyl isomerase